MNSRLHLPSVTLTLVLCGLILVGAGCEPEMPIPPPRESKNPAEDDFLWAMERMEHAIEQFQPSTSLGLSVKRKLDYQLISPSGKESNYTARVTIAMKTVYRPDPPLTAKEKKRADEEKEREANKLKLDNPYGLPGDDPLGTGELQGRDILPAELPALEVPDPRIPTQQLNEKKEYLLEYVAGQWKLQSAELEGHERLWFDYALQQGEFAPEASTDR